jgi:glyoxylase-like metal-dependent hydrolase (beta-lactamase superfamily II)
MKTLEVDVIIKPTLLRFSILKGDLIYYFCNHADTALDGLNKMMGINPQKAGTYECNLGYLPVCNTVLIRGEKNIIVDPGNFHIGFYGLLMKSLEPYKLNLEDIDFVIVTHAHHDHLASTYLMQNSTLFIGQGELESAAKTLYWPEYIEAMVTSRVRDIITIHQNEEQYKVMEGVYILSTPGHTPGSIAVLVDDGTDRIAVIGDTVLTREGYLYRKMEQWNTREMNIQCNKILDVIASYNPTRVIPGHDFEFRIEYSV